MRNLKLIKQSCIAKKELVTTSLICKDYAQKILYFLKANNIYQLSLDSEEVVAFKDLTREDMLREHVVNSSDTNIVAMDYMFMDQTVNVAWSDGLIASYDALTQEMVRTFDIFNGIESVTWSPDQEVGVVVNANGALTVLTHDLIPICEEVSVQSDEFGQSKPVTVGWGKKETQFHGSQGKAAAKLKTEIGQAAFKWDKGTVLVTWRGDGQLFAISSISPTTGSRNVRVFDCQGVLQYTSDVVDGLEDTLCWQPSGALIAATVRRPNKHEVVFFEKNCLRHGEFTLPFTPQQVKINKLIWNSESNVLAVWCEDNQPLLTGDSSPTVNYNSGSSLSEANSYILIWTVNNYHWYLKQTLNFGASDGGISFVDWDPESSHQLNILCTNGRYLSYTWAFTVDRSLGSNGRNAGTVAVIDNSRVLVTPFQSVVVPPPMSAYTLDFTQRVNCVAFGPSDDLAVVTEDNVLHLFTAEVGSFSANVENKVGSRFRQQLAKHVLKGSCQIPSSHLESPPLAKHHWTWINSTTIMFTETIGTMSTLQLMLLSRDPIQPLFLTLDKEMCIEEVVSISLLFGGHSVAILLSDGSVLEIDCDKWECKPWLKRDGTACKVPQPCNKMTSPVLNGTGHILTLSDTFVLMFDGQEIANNCTSYFFSGDYLIYTSYDHVLHCVLASSLDDLVSDKKVISMTEQLRNLERGSSIVTVISTDMKVVLQMPRGNLETIFPRALVLLLIRHHLNAFQYKEAVTLMRKHRIDLNLIVDHDPLQFIKNVDQFISQMEPTEWIDVFLSTLQEEDVTRSMYKIAYDTQESSANLIAGPKIKSKVDLVCDTVVKGMEKLDSKRYFLQILTAHAKKTIPELDVALRKIKQLKDEESLSLRSVEISTDVALKHILYLVDVNDLYNVALGTYDFGLVVMVAEKSQKDPKEYLPFLNELQCLEMNYRKYTIDKYLKKYNSALHHIAQCCLEGHDQHFEELVKLVKTYELFGTALKAFPVNTKPYQDIAELYGDHLAAKQNFDEAGLMYAKGHLYEKSLLSFQKSCNWKQAFSIAYKLHYEEENIVLLARRFAATLKSNKKFGDAAYILEFYAKDPEKSITSLVEGHDWEMAWLIINKHQRLDMAESHLFPALTNHYAILISTLVTLRSSFVQFQQRLVSVRDEQQRKLSSNQRDDGIVDSDLFSDSSTISGYTQASRSNASSSRFTTRTGRNKKKQDRKKVTLKVGSQYEDIALLESLTKIIAQTDGIKEECADLNRALVLHNYENEAANLQSELESFIRYMVSCKSEIWLPIESTNNLTDVRMGPQSTANSITAAFREQTLARDIPEEYNQFLSPPSLRSNIEWKLDCLKI